MFGTTERNGWLNVFTRFVLCSRRVSLLFSLLGVAACGIVPGPADFSPVPDLVHVVLWRTSETEISGYVPVCPGDQVDVGLSVDQTIGADGGVGVAANEGTISGNSAKLLELRFAPDVSLTGSVTDEVPRSATAGGFVRPVTQLDELGGFYISTSRTYAAGDFDVALPEVGEGWVFVGGGTPNAAGDLETELQDALASVDCDEAPE